MYAGLGVENPNMVIGDLMFFVADIFVTGVQYGARTDQCDLLTGKGFLRDLWRGMGIYAKQKGVAAHDYDR